MADVNIDATASNASARVKRAVKFLRTDPSIGYWFYIDSNATFSYSKTTDGGATWGAAVAISAQTTDIAGDSWADWETPGDTGTLIHTWFFDTAVDDVRYRSLDTNGDSLGTERVVFSAASAVAGRGSFVSGTKTRSGYLYCAVDVDAGAELATCNLFRSTDGGTTWSANLSTTFVEATIDDAVLYPASNTGDNNDCWAVYQDASADALTLKMWDSSAANATESATIQAMTEFITDLGGQNAYAAAVRHSDGHLIIVSCSLRLGAGTGDMQCYDVNGTGSITNKTDIATNVPNIYYPSVFIDQTTDHIYVAYSGKRDNSETLGTATTVNYVKSTDGGTTWSTGDTAYQQGAASADIQVWTPLSGSRFYAGWRVGTTLIGNAVNSLSFSVVERRVFVTGG